MRRGRKRAFLVTMLPIVGYMFALVVLGGLQERTVRRANDERRLPRAGWIGHPAHRQQRPQHHCSKRQMPGNQAKSGRHFPSSPQGWRITSLQSSDGVSHSAQFRATNNLAGWHRSSQDMSAGTGDQRQRSPSVHLSGSAALGLGPVCIGNRALRPADASNRPVASHI
jgi:hypothetical protein